ncbi:acyl-CoA desaturase [Hahella sp. CCB-MM4]|uniref:acyl-CoA desaturase n=1 Tax=Hahella sp. (strain CCB-MM4) TaxID=1926491 RepID=UPI000B9A85DB|nr:acyl-CoA desaturase [Hahella sp. CCB-MM4]OZG70209.1 acyl-CoA desaturase [Hahella sp. CCB-MM4]
MDTNNETPRMAENPATNADSGNVVWSPIKSMWYLSHLMIGTIGGIIFFSWSAFSLFIVFTALTLCLGHSLGMHRRLIHNSYECPKWMEYLFVHLGVLVGMAGPFSMVYQHDIRDWAQRKSECHPFLRHGSSFFKDGWWQLNCDLRLNNPPKFIPEMRIRNNKIYRFMERTWMFQQLPWTVLFFYIGGISWVIWGISARIAISVTGHWLIGYFAHNEGSRDWHINGAAVQGHNVRFAGLITMGESWHNNHHAYPGSAMLGIYQGQNDPGWWVLNALNNLGLVWNIRLPKDLSNRSELQKIHHEGVTIRNYKLPKPCKFISMVGKVMPPG